jgi:hypothetical protein
MTAKRACVQCGKLNAQPPARLCYTCKKANGKAAAVKRHEAHVTGTYSLQPGEYAKLSALQGHVCAICGGKSGAKKLAVDHSHVSGEVRGLLCRRCNYQLLGQIAKDDPERLAAIAQAAIAYLTDTPYQRMLRGETA